MRSSLPTTDWFRQHRVITLVGPAGIGKSWLARASLEGTARVICSLDGVAEEDIARAIARACGVRLGRNDDPIEVIQSAIEGRVLVLDNVDPIVGPIARLVSSLGENTRVLVTSGEPLGLAVERVHTVERLSQDDAIAMFESEAEDAFPREDVALLVERLEGIPLAIELAARRSRVVSPAELVPRIDERLDVLRSDRRDVPARHLTLAATFEWSWSLLGEQERRGLAALAVFAGPAPLESFEAVADLEDDPINVADSLLRRSLVVRAEGTETRLGMSRLLRSYVRKKLAADESLFLKHGQATLTRIEELRKDSYGVRAKEVLDALAAIAPEGFLAFERLEKTAPETAVAILTGLEDAIILRNALNLDSSYFARVRALAPDNARVLVLCAKALLELGKTEDAAALLRDAPHEDAVHRSLGWALLACGEPDAAIERLTIAAKSSDVRSRADALAAWGLGLCFLGDVEAGHQKLAAAHAIHVGSGDSVRREKVDEIARLVGLKLSPLEADARGRLLASADGHRKAGRPWREAIDLALVSTIKEDDVPELTDALARGLAFTEGDAWLVGPEALWIEPPGKERLDLGRHGSLRRVLDELVTRRLDGRPACSADDLLSAGWPGERVRHDSGMLRVYTAVRRLRKLGVDIVTRDEGYFLDPNVPFRRVI